MEQKISIQSLTISIPAYNESKSLKKLVEESQKICTELCIESKMLIVNDGSKDHTYSVALELADKFGNIQVVNHEHNLGFGETLKKVFSLPDSEWVLFLPGDNQFPVKNIVKFLPYANDYDFIIGYRKIRKDAWNRKLYSSIYNLCVSLVSGYKVRDVNSIVFYRSSILNSFNLKGQSVFVHAEFFIKTAQAGFRIAEVEIEHQEREFGFGSGGNLRVLLQTIRDLFLYAFGKI